MADASIEIRKRPVQARSKARVEAILNAAKTIISEVGSDGMKMNALAQQAGVPIGTVYQFFPNKSAVIHTLVHTTLDELSHALQDQFKDVVSVEDAAVRLGDAVRNYCRHLRDDPITSDILASTQGDKNLRALDQQDSLRNSDMMFGVIAPLVCETQHKALETLCFMNVHLTGSLARFCATLDPTRAASMQAQFIKSIQRDLRAFSPAK
ncbi:MAG: TetR family transcriptional regulator [Sedimentitalea sp.]